MFIQAGGYSEKADVYSFAIVLWQIYSQAQPYPKLHASQVLFQVARDGMRPRIPSKIPLNVVSLIKRCWDHEPERRPSFSEIAAELVVMRDAA